MKLKSINILVSALLMILIVTGCNSYKVRQEKVVDRFYQFMHDGDLNKAYQLTSKVDRDYKSVKEFEGRDDLSINTKKQFWSLVSWQIEKIEMTEGRTNVSVIINMPDIGTSLGKSIGGSLSTLGAFENEKEVIKNIKLGLLKDLERKNIQFVNVTEKFELVLEEGEWKLFFNWANETVSKLNEKIKDKKTSLKQKTAYSLELANLLHYVIGDGKNAKKYYLIVLKNDKQNFAAYLNYGIILQKESNFEVAFEDLKKAVQLQPDSARANFYLGLNFLKIGNLENGYLYLAKAGQLSSDYLQNPFPGMIFTELAGVVPYDKDDIKLMKKYREFFINSPEYKNKFDQLLKKLDTFK